MFDGRTDVALARIKDTENSVLLTITESDDPNGMFEFPLDSRDVKVAEDYAEGMSATAQAQLRVQRTRGVFGNVAVCWLLTYWTKIYLVWRL